MLVLGLLAETLTGMVLGFLVPSAGRKMEILLSTIGVIVVILFSGLITNLNLVDIAVLLVGWISVMNGIILGKRIRTTLELKKLRSRLARALPYLICFIKTCDDYVHQRGVSREDLDECWRQVHESTYQVRIGPISGLVDELYDLSLLLAQDGLTEEEEHVWNKAVYKAQQMLQET